MQDSLPPRRPLLIALESLALLSPLILLVALVARYSVNVPYADQWSFVPTLERMYSGQLSFGDLWEQHNEHRLVFPRILMLALAWLSGWDIRWEAAASLVIACVNAVLLLSMLRRTASAVDPALAWWLGPAICAIVFSPAQSENWLWGWQVQWHMNVLGVLLIVWALPGGDQDPGPRGFAIACAGALLATFSLASGTFAWASGLLLLPRRPARATVLWIALAALVVTAYWTGYSTPERHQHDPFSDPAGALVRMFTFLGLALSVSQRVSTPVGLVTFALFGFSVLVLTERPRHLPCLLPWVSLGAYSAATALAVGANRPGLGTGTFPFFRYATIAALFTVSALVAAAVAWRTSEGPRGWLLPGLFWCLLIGLIVTSYRDGMNAMRKLHNTFGLARVLLARLDTASDRELGRVAHEPALVRKGAPFLARMGLAGLTALPASGTPPGRSSR